MLNLVTAGAVVCCNLHTWPQKRMPHCFFCFNILPAFPFTFFFLKDTNLKCFFTRLKNSSFEGIFVVEKCITPVYVVIQHICGFSCVNIWYRHPSKLWPVTAYKCTDTVKTPCLGASCYFLLFLVQHKQLPEL